MRRRYVICAISNPDVIASSNVPPSVDFSDTLGSSEAFWKCRYAINPSIALTLVAAVGLCLLLPEHGYWRATSDCVRSDLAGLWPTGRGIGWRALQALWWERVLDIDLLMIVAAIAAATVDALPPMLASS